MKSSTCREAGNLTDRLEWLVLNGLLLNHEVFLITDNSVFEEAYYKGQSPLYYSSPRHGRHERIGVEVRAYSTLHYVYTVTPPQSIM
jgi:hypothetical protein